MYLFFFLGSLLGEFYKRFVYSSSWREPFPFHRTRGPLNREMGEKKDVTSMSRGVSWNFLWFITVFIYLEFLTRQGRCWLYLLPRNVYLDFTIDVGFNYHDFSYIISGHRVRFTPTMSVVTRVCRPCICEPIKPRPTRLCYRFETFRWPVDSSLQSSRLVVYLCLKRTGNCPVLN